MKIKPAQPLIKLVSDGHTIAVKSVDEAMELRAGIIRKLLEIVKAGQKRN